MKAPRLACAALALSTSALACSSASSGPELETEKDLLANKAFVAISRDAPFSESERDGAFDAIGVAKADILEEDLPSDFYLAIHRDQLNERWFLSAYVRQFFPGAVFGGAARSLGTAVVTFEVQNNKLFMVSADDRHASGDVFEPTVILDAFPVVTDFEQFEDLPNAENYVLFDPASGLNDFAVAGDMFSATVQSRFGIDLSFLQAFRSVDDGVTYEQVFTGHSETADFENDLGDSPFRAAGTLGVSLRQYSEGAGYEQTQLPEQDHFFTGDLAMVPNEGTLSAVAAKWNIKKGGKPIEWVVSREVLKLQNNPLFADYDILGAFEDGIESWNQAFGFPALTARVAEEGEDFSQDDKNVFIVDLDPTAGFAFANWRTNPNTGEIRGASIYFSSTFLLGAVEAFDPEEPADGGDVDSLVGQKRPQIAALSWVPLHSSPGCDIHGPQMFDEAAAAAAAADDMTPKQKVEAILRYVSGHEVGHTLGLRHNFMGSLLPPSSSVMDYLPMEQQLEMKGPGDYDVAAIQYLYGISDELPAQPFCTDAGSRIDPTCATFDAGADPLVEVWQPRYAFAVSFLADGSLGDDFNKIVADYGLQPMLNFVRAASPADRLRAWNMVIDELEALGETEAGAFGADFFMHYALEQLFLAPPEELGNISAPVPAADVALMTAIRTQVGAILRNDDEIRSFESRRAMVDVLKKMQATPALSALISARDAITVASEDMTGEELLLTDDLLARITAALTPYFE